MLKVIASEQVEPLVEDLARNLTASPLDPMTPEWIAVGSIGLARWLQLELAGHLGARSGLSDGVAANITIASPGSLRTAALVAGEPHPQFDPWLSNRITWAALETLAKADRSDTLLTTFFDTSNRTMYQRARQIEQRFAAYHMHRPEMIRAWNNGDDVDRRGRPLTSDQLWQPHLWRLIRQHLATASPPERLLPALAEIRRNLVDLVLDDTTLPPRLIFFGPSLLPTGVGFLEVAEAVAEHRDVFVYVIEPSSSLALDLRTNASELAPDLDRTHDVSADVAKHPLLRSWGRLQRETALILAGQPLQVVPSEPPSDDNLLHQLQADIHLNRAPAGAFNLADDDNSVTVHRCYGAIRQVEALRDSLLAMIDDPKLGLNEDDIIVACPALTTFAPLINAVFGMSATKDHATAADGTPLLRYRITGLPAPEPNPVTEGLLAALKLASGRFDVDDVSDFLTLRSVRNRFGWTDSDVEALNAWISDTNIRWGLDGTHRERFGMTPPIESFTWGTALDQIIMGTAVRSDDATTIGGSVTVDIGATDVALAGQFAAVIDTLKYLADVSEESHSIQEWATIVDDIRERLLAADENAEWQVDATRRHLLRMVNTSKLMTPGSDLDDDNNPRPSTVALTFRDVYELLSDTAAKQRARSDFFRGGITITTLNALRNVPARVICILGADQAAFSSTSPDTDDLVAIDPRLGDRDPRAEVRQTLLDALLAAKERLVLFSDGTDVRTNTDIPPAVVVSELFDAVNVTCGDQTAAESITVTHPRQPFAESYFNQFTPQGRSFSRSALAAASARRGRRETVSGIDWTQVLLDHPMADPSEQITLTDLHATLKDPTKVFLRDGVGVQLPGEIDMLSPELPIEGDDLDNWAIGTQILGRLDPSEDSGHLVERLIKLGKLPPEPLASNRIGPLISRAQATLEAAAEQGVNRQSLQTVSVEFDLTDGRRVAGQVQVDRSAGQRLVPFITFSRAKDSQMLQVWLDLLALTAVDDSEPWRAVLVNSPGKPNKKSPIPLPTIRRLHTADLSSLGALNVLQMVAKLHDTAIRQPVPLFPDVFGWDADVEPKAADWRGFGRPLSPHLIYVYGDIPLSQLRGITAPGHPLINSGDPLAEAYAELIWSAFDSTIRVEDVVLDDRSGEDVTADLMNAAGPTKAAGPTSQGRDYE